MKRFRISGHREAAPLKIDYEKELNVEQLRVVMHPGGPMLVLAGAGTGKTRTVTYRVARLIETGTHPSQLLLLTFTNKAASEMMHRAETLVGKNIRGLWGGTFHHIGNMILRRHAALLGYRMGFTILDREDQKELLESSLSGVVKADRSLPKGGVLVQILSYHRNTAIPVEEVIETRFSHTTEAKDEILKAFKIYDLRKHQLNLMDFDDLLLNTLRLLEENRELREYYSSRFRQVLVDEFQDTNIIQARLADLLASTHRNIMVVGDDAQSIYSFRGARAENILNFPERYPDVNIFKLTTNYRSTPEVLALANEVISHNLHQFHKELSSVKSSGDKPMIVPLADLYEQAEFVASRVTELIDEGVNSKDIAILYRSHYQSMEMQLELQRRNIPYEVRSGLRFFEQAHIKDILSFLRILLNPYSELSWKRILKMIPNIGNVTAHRIWEQISSKESPLNEIKKTYRLIPKRAVEGFGLLISTIEGITKINYKEDPADAISYILANLYEDYLYNTYPDAESRYEDIEQLIRYSHHYSADRELPYSRLELLLSDLTLESTHGKIESEDERNGIVLSSVHQAKGLEWSHVFIIGLNEGRFPSRKSLAAGGEEEERRLFYVACTRSKEELYLCYTLTDNGYSGFTRLSRFLSELSEGVFESVFVPSF
jgi:DNA helicase-2/ATP-dependent DNA helicase PcrA